MPAHPVVTMARVEGYEHRVAAHCETGSVRNLLRHSGVEVSEPMIFGVGSGPLFYYLFFAKGPSKLPLIGIRNAPGTIVRNVRKLCGIDLSVRRHRTVGQAIAEADAFLERGTPVTATVDMFRMKYLPSFLRVHAPFHFIILVGKEDGQYLVSDPYSEKLGRLDPEDLAAAWETHAPMARDNMLCRLATPPRDVDWRRAALRGIRRTCGDMVLPPIVRRLMFFVGVQGMRTYARKIRAWTERYRGVALREGIMFSAIGFEDQGTGGGAFRLMYGAFLREAAGLFSSDGLREMGDRMIEIGKQWRQVARRMIVLAKPMPTDDAAYDDWLARDGKILHDGLDEVSRTFSGLADAEERFYRDLRAAAAGLRA